MKVARVALALTFLFSAAFAQDARIEGRLKRPYEAAIWPAKVLLIDVQTVEVRSATVEAEQARFMFDGVKPGVYHVVAAGIKCFKGVPKDVVVRAGAVHKVTVKLKFDSHLCEVVTVE